MAHYDCACMPEWLAIPHIGACQKERARRSVPEGACQNGSLSCAEYIRCSGRECNIE